MQILDRKVEYGDLDAEDPGWVKVHSVELSLMESNSNFNPPTRLKWKSVEEILQWRTNSWVRLLAETRRLFQWPQKFKGKDVYDFTAINKKVQDFWFRSALKEISKAQKKGRRVD